jgi:hypothetical protein
MSTFKKYERKNEAVDYVKDPFREGISVWVFKIHLGENLISQFVGSVDGINDEHTAIISVHVSSLPGEVGEDLAKQERFIIHQKDFKEKGDAIKHLLEMKNQIILK